MRVQIHLSANRLRVHALLAVLLLASPGVAQIVKTAQTPAQESKQDSVVQQAPEAPRVW